MLNAPDRVKLSTAMLSDVLGAVRNVSSISHVTVVSADRKVRQIARSHRADFIWEGMRRGLNKGVRLALLDAERRGASAAVIIHSDIPFANSREISRFLTRCQSYSVGMVPSRDCSGTNVLFLKPPSIMKPLFGKQSYWKHRHQAERQGVSFKVVRSRTLGFDVDEPKDLGRLLSYRGSSETGKFLRTLRECL
jgi:2-phospho-L-lactate guanylyltransferase